MKLPIRALALLLIVILIAASAYLFFIKNEQEKPDTTDTQVPQIDFITGNTTGTAGKTTTISARFSDNKAVTIAVLYYKSASASTWNSDSILNGTVDIMIPQDAFENIYYYIVVDDEAGNGPVGQPSIDGSTYYIITVTTNGNNGDEPLIHTVFVEEATASWCNNCPNVANILHDLYKNNNYNFYYVSLINGSNTQADRRLNIDYNISGYPSVFIDGGHSVILGGNNPSSVYADAIVKAQQRSVPPIKILITAEYQNTTQEVIVTTVVENKGTEPYNGLLKLYLTEIVSHLIGYDNKPYSYSFIDYLIVQEISISANSQKTVTERKNIAEYDHENLNIIAVVFSSQKQVGYADPKTATNPFDAYYADATDATRVVEGGNLPPTLQITSPEKGKIYIRGTPRLNFLIERNPRLKLWQNSSLLKILLHNKTVLYGNKIIMVTASDDSKVEKVEFHIDGELYFTDTEAPYEWTFTKLSTPRSLLVKDHTLKVIAYDDTGKTSTVELVFKARL